MIAEDENGSNQIISVGIIQQRTEENFVHYFTQLKSFLPKVSLFIVDRNQAQINALKTVWPDSNIMFCAVHIQRNLDTVDKTKNKEFLNAFKDMLKKKMAEDTLLQKFRDRANANNDKLAHMLEELLKHQECWLPSHTNQFVHRKNYSTNRVEGFFGELKRQTDHQIEFFTQFFEIIIRIAEKQFSRSQKVNTIKCDPIIINELDYYKLGTLPLQIMNDEFSKMMNSDDVVYLAKRIVEGHCTCHIACDMNLPCKHLFALQKLRNEKPPLLPNLNNIEERWKHNYNPSDNTHPQISVQRVTKSTHQPKDYSFHNCQASFEEMFSIAHRSKIIQNLLDKTLIIYAHLQSQNFDISKKGKEAEAIINNYFSDWTIQLQQEWNQFQEENEENLGGPMFPIGNMKCTRLRGAQDTHPRLNCDLRRTHERRNNKKKKEKKRKIQKQRTRNNML